jgi:hypothetical protein
MLPSNHRVIIGLKIAHWFSNDKDESEASVDHLPKQQPGFRSSFLPKRGQKRSPLPGD